MPTWTSTYGSTYDTGDGYVNTSGAAGTFSWSQIVSGSGALNASSTSSILKVSSNLISGARGDSWQCSRPFFYVSPSTTAHPDIIPQTATITELRLTLNISTLASQLNPANVSIRIYKGTQADATYAEEDYNAFDSGVHSGNFSIASTGTTVLTVTSGSLLDYIQAQISAGNDLAFCLRTSYDAGVIPPAAENAVSFGGDSSPSIPNRPKIEIDYTLGWTGEINNISGPASVDSILKTNIETISGI